MNRIISELIKREINILDKEEPEYPLRLKETGSPPKRIYCIGGLPDDDRPSVAIIGARNCSGYGRQMAREFAMEIAGAGIQVISGMATGIDGIAQNGALAAGGKSFAVLGGGVDICYPKENSRLYEALLDNGGVISEHEPGTEPIARFFASRNRIISALSDAVLVIEARRRSGTLITVGFALDQGKDVYALPGRVNDSLSCGCNELIKDGAYPLINPYDFVREFMDRYELGRINKGKGQKAVTGKSPAGQIKTDAGQKSGKDRNGSRADAKGGSKSHENLFLTAAERAVMSALDYEPKTVSEIFYDLSDKTDMSIPELLGLLTDMTLKHHIDCVDGMNYCIRS